LYYSIEGATFPVSSLSSGEREVVNVVFDFLLRSPHDCVVIFDESVGFTAALTTSTKECFGKTIGQLQTMLTAKLEEERTRIELALTGADIAHHATLSAERIKKALTKIATNGNS